MSRDKTLDFLRVFSMFLVIVIHVANCYGRSFSLISSSSFAISSVFNMLSRVSVPIFFMISGALLIPKVLTREKYIYKVKRMFIVLVLWTVIYALFEYFYVGVGTNVLNLLVAPQRAHLWFMYAIIAIYIALPFISKMCNNLTKREENLFMGLWFFAFLFEFLVKRLLKVSVIYHIPIISGVYYLGYFVIGHIIYKRIREGKCDYKKYNKYLVLLFIFSNLVILWFTLYNSFRLGSNYKVFFTYSNPLMIISSLSVYSLVLINMNKIPSFVSYFAPFSFGIYLVHGIFLDVLKTFNFINVNSIIGVPLFSAILFFVSYIVIYLLKKIPKIDKYIC